VGDVSASVFVQCIDAGRIIKIILQKSRTPVTKRTASAKKAKKLTQFLAKEKAKSKHAKKGKKQARSKDFSKKELPKQNTTAKKVHTKDAKYRRGKSQRGGSTKVVLYLPFLSSSSFLFPFSFLPLYASAPPPRG
jgi:hypothetical protein